MEVHDDHPWGDIFCQGFTAEAHGVHLLVQAIYEFVRPYYPPMKLPAGAQIEMHPATANAVMRNTFPTATDLAKGPAMAFDVICEIPVVQTTSIAPGGWRIVFASGSIA
jgi:hypothetical protein